MSDTIYDQFCQTAQAYPGSPFLLYPASKGRPYCPEGLEISYGAALATVDSLADAYRMAGYGPGHRVAQILGNRPEHFLHLFALNKVGATVVPLNPDYLPHELIFGIEFAECALIVAAPPSLDHLRVLAQDLKTPLPVFNALDPASVVPAPGRAPAAPELSPADQEAMIIYTSGTTGRPKGCVIPNRSCLAAGENYATAGGLITFERARERLYNVFPTFHMNMTIYALNGMTYVAGCLVVQDRFSASSWWSDIRTSKATCFHYLGIVPSLLLKQEPTSDDRNHNARFGYGGGVDPDIREAFEARFGAALIEAWGMTETCRAIQNNEEPRCLDPRAFGRPSPPLEVRIADENDAPLPFNTPGELLIRSRGDDPRDGFFSSYLNQPDETAHAWRNGWFHTGDIVRQSADGMLTFVDRRKNIIRRSGENISATEIEEALNLDPRVKSVAVLAVHDEFHDEEVMACIILMNGQEPSAGTAHAIVGDARIRLALHKLPAWLAFVDELPLTGTQRVRKDLIFNCDDPREDPRSYDLRSLKRRNKAPAPA